MMTGMKTTLPLKDWEILSSFLDDELDPQQKKRVEEQLANNPTLQKGLEELRRTRKVLRAAPQRRIPRSFTLTPEMASKANPFSWLITTFSLSSAAAAILAVMLIGFEILPFLGGFLGSTAPVAMKREVDQATVLESAPAAESVSEDAEQPEIIFWNAPGMGGGEETIAEGLGGGPVMPLGIGGGEETQPEGYVVIIPTEPSHLKEMPSATMQPETMDNAQPTMEAEVQSEAEAPKEAAPETETYPKSEDAPSPILGIQPTSQDVFAVEPTPTQDSNLLTSSQVIQIRRIAAGIAGVLALFLAAAALIFARRSHR